MYFVEYDIKKLNEEKHKRKSEKNHPLHEIIEEFQFSGLKCAKLVDMDYRHSKTAYECFKHHLDRYDIRHIKVCIRNGEVYLINDLIKE